MSRHMRRIKLARPPAGELKQIIVTRSFFTGMNPNLKGCGFDTGLSRCKGTHLGWPATAWVTRLNGWHKNPLIHDTLKQFYKLTGLTVKLRPATEPQFKIPVTAFCRQVTTLSGGCPICQQLQTQLFHRLAAKLKAHQLFCPAGIIHLAVPVVVAGNHVATIVGDSVRLRMPSPARFACCCRQLGLHAHNGRLRLLRRAFFSTPALTPPELAAAVKLLQTLAQFFGLALQQPNPAAHLNPEPARVVIAKQFVREHLAEPLTTAQAAAAAGVTNSYFCRLFHQSTGQTFHDYLASLRVTAAQAALARTLQPISEIAFAVGFQSIPDFNRVFKHKTQMAPSQYRRTHYQAVVP